MHLLNDKGIKHSVLNAKNHEKEADIIADAGKPYSVTCATNMAGRGTDIQLGGNLNSLVEKNIGFKLTQDQINAVNQINLDNSHFNSYIKLLFNIPYNL